jgi:predicted alpha/beta hydrolase family esterase
VAWWAEYERLASGPKGQPVVGALLVAPPDVEHEVRDRRLTRFAPLPAHELPFPAIVVAAAMIPMPASAPAPDGRALGRALCRCRGGRPYQRAIGPGEWSFGRLLLNRLLPRPLSSRKGRPAMASVPRRFIDPALRRLGA